MVGGRRRQQQSQFAVGGALVRDALKRGEGRGSFLDLLVGEHEDGRLGLHARAAVERLEVLEQVVGVVRLGERDLEARGVADVRGEARERLLARAADADEQRAAAREAKRRVMRMRCSRASWKKTRSMRSSLYASLNCSMLHRLGAALRALGRQRLVDLGRGEELARLGVLVGVAQEVDKVDLLLACSFSMSAPNLEAKGSSTTKISLANHALSFLSTSLSEKTRMHSCFHSASSWNDESSVLCTSI